MLSELTTRSIICNGNINNISLIADAEFLIRIHRKYDTVYFSSLKMISSFYTFCMVLFANRYESHSQLFHFYTTLCTYMHDINHFTIFISSNIVLSNGLTNDGKMLILYRIMVLNIMWLKSKQIWIFARSDLFTKAMYSSLKYNLDELLTVKLLSTIKTAE